MAAHAKHVWAVDPHDIVPSAGLFGFAGDDLGRYAQGTLPVLQENLRKAGLARKVTIIRAHSEDWHPDWPALRGVSFAFIDGNHSFQIAKGDFTLCSQMVRPGGVVAMHDYGEGNNPDVKRVVDACGYPFKVVGTLAIIQL